MASRAKRRVQYRKETDSFGVENVPKFAYFGAETQRAALHFAIGKDRMPKAVIHALALVKKGAALVNLKLGRLDSDKAKWIIQACEELLDHKLEAHFPLKVWQSGSGTQTNMNVNEVIAHRASELAGFALGTKGPIHPNDHVNMSQSSNDVFPTAMHIAAAYAVQHGVLPALEKMIRGLQKKVSQFRSIIKIGRTHLQDATPLSLGQEFSGYVALLEQARGTLMSSLQGLHLLAIGGTAVGTGLNAPAHFGDLVSLELSNLTGLTFLSHPNKFAALSCHLELLVASSALKVLSCALMKIANDLRLLASGPRCGLGELILPANEPGSSIMPGKVNPTQCEALTMVATQVIAIDQAITIASTHGHLELNTFKPLIIYNFLHATTLLTGAMGLFLRHCIQGIQANRTQIAKHLQRSLMLVTALSPHVGYDIAAKVANMAYQRNLSLKETCVELGLMTAEEFDRKVDPKKMI
jgi:fumarate hydratase class II